MNQLCSSFNVYYFIMKAIYILKYRYGNCEKFAVIWALGKFGVSSATDQA